MTFPLKLKFSSFLLGLGCCSTCWSTKTRWCIQDSSFELLEWEDSEGYLLWQLQASHWYSWRRRKVHEKGNLLFLFKNCFRWLWWTTILWGSGNLLMVAGAGTGEIYHSLSPFLGDQQILWLHAAGEVSSVRYDHGCLRH